MNGLARCSKKMIMSACAVLLFVSLTGDARAQAEDSPYEIGLRFVVLNARGEPTNDMLGGGLYGRYRLNDRWLIGAAVDSVSGDFERPYLLVGLASPMEIDATDDSLLISVWAEREYGNPARKSRWFWGAGLGFTSPDVNDVTGPVTGGGTFDLTTDAGSETIVMLNGGFRTRIGRRFSFEVSVRADQHFADWKITDRMSGMTGTIDDYTVVGLNVGGAIRF